MPLGAGLVGLGLVLLGAAVCLAVLPVSPRDVPSEQGEVSCGAPFTAVGREDGGASLAALSRSQPGGAGPRRPATRADLARIGELERDAAWYGACHAPAHRRMVLANALAFGGLALGASGSLLLRLPSGSRQALRLAVHRGTG